MTISPLLGPAAVELARDAVGGYTAESVDELLGASGRAASARGDIAGVRRALRGADGRLATLVRLFLLGDAVSEGAARAALRPLDLGSATALLEVSGDEVRAAVEVRPHAIEGGPNWWTVSDFGSDVRPGPLRSDHVLGIGAASLTLAQATVRRPVARALDIGTGSGVQALHLGSYARTVVATDVSVRALRFAATSAALSGQSWELRQGSLLDPVAGERFGAVVANPPFVVSAGLDGTTGGYDYRDSGLPGDAVTERLVRGIPAVLEPEGTATLLANWVLTQHEQWDDRIEGWLAGSGCDAWIWRREIVDPAGYVTLWLRDAGEVPGTARWQRRYDDWCDWFERSAIAGVGMGLINLRRTERRAPTIVCEDVPQEVEQPTGPSVAAWFDRQAWLTGRDSARLRGAHLAVDDELARVTTTVLADREWTVSESALQQLSGMRWRLDMDEALAGVLAASDGSAPLDLAVSLLAAMSGLDDEVVWHKLEPVVRDLVARGVLLPVE